MDSLDRLHQKVEAEVDRPYRTLLKGVIDDADSVMSSRGFSGKQRFKSSPGRPSPRRAARPRNPSRKSSSPSRRSFRAKGCEKSITGSSQMAMNQLGPGALEALLRPPSGPASQGALLRPPSRPGSRSGLICSAAAMLSPARPSSRGGVAGAGDSAPDMRRPSTSSNELVWIARARNLSLDTCKQAWELFRPHADLDGSLSKEQFTAVLCQVTGSATVAELPPGLLVDDAFAVASNVAAKGNDAALSFADFALWYSSLSFDQFITLSSSERKIRDLARKYNMTIVDVDRYWRHFDESDTDRGGTIGQDEFESLLRKCAKVPADVEIPPTRFRQLWKDCDIDGSGEIDFEEFVQFYRRYFDDSNGESLGFEGYYRSLRPVSAVHW
eukprot:TRINITY_DN2556_c0_g1_i1.p1 TRINITY_DN2556_c0_g1~~TRINITY_DN2556_c0_g1_i1.p1  ORF type:complete len:419 (+),score=76.33 TRINITY_DN2556_c0_g1_i1:106-1257(+)